jgi:hypothetical protein
MQGVHDVIETSDRHYEGGDLEVQEVLAQARDAMSVKRVFGEPYEKNGVTVIPAARVQGGAGGGAARGRRARAWALDRVSVWPPARSVHT